VLRWTWDNIVEPVLAALELTGPASPGQETHLWWCATGLTAFLPLHAAGDYRRDRVPHGALDLVVSSYTPTLRTLAQLRQRKPDRQTVPHGPLIVAMPKTPDMAELESTEEEAENLAARFTTHQRVTGCAATKDAVMTAMPQHLWSHFACHGSQNLLRPDEAALHLHDGPLAITEITKLQLPALELAYLSACETNRGSTAVPDEAITLASALHIAGYQNVIATLWQVSGLTAVDIARHVYNQITIGRDGTVQIDASNAASALRKAVLAVRDDSGLPAIYWAPYIHSGP
jgi:CHAT domain-containing protein